MPGDGNNPGFCGQEIQRPLKLLPSRYNAWQANQLPPALAIAAFWSSIVVAAAATFPAALAASANFTASSLPFAFQKVAIVSNAADIALALAEPAAVSLAVNASRIAPLAYAAAALIVVW